MNWMQTGVYVAGVIIEHDQRPKAVERERYQLMMCLFCSGYRWLSVNYAV